MNLLNTTALSRILRSPADDGGAAAPAAPAEAPAAAPQAPAGEAPAAPEGGTAAEGEAADATLLGGKALDDKPAEAGKEGDALAGGEAEGGEGGKVEGAAETPKLDAEAITPPEGFALLDKDALTAALPDLEAMGLDQEGAQKVVDLAGKILPGLIERAVTQHNDAMLQQAADVRKEWHDDALKDPDIGGKGEATFAQNMALAARAMDMFGSPALKDAMNATGLGNNPEVIRFMIKAGRAISEDAVFTSAATAKPTVEGDVVSRLAASYGDAYQKKT